MCRPRHLLYLHSLCSLSAVTLSDQWLGVSARGTATASDGLHTICDSSHMVCVHMPLGHMSFVHMPYEYVLHGHMPYGLMS